MSKATLHSALNSFVESKLKQVYTSLPCVVIRVYDGLTEHKVDVKPSIQILEKDGESYDMPAILQVPVMFPSSKTSAFTFPIMIGDTVMCVFSQRGLDAFKVGDGSPSRPVDYRSLDVKDAVAIPGLHPFQQAPLGKKVLTGSSADCVITHNIGKSTEVEIRMKEDGSIKITSPTKVEVVCQDASVTATNLLYNATNTVWNGNITFTGSYTFTGPVSVVGTCTTTALVSTAATIGGVVFNTHIHSNPEGGFVGPAVNP